MDERIRTECNAALHRFLRNQEHEIDPHGRRNTRHPERDLMIAERTLLRMCSRRLNRLRVLYSRLIWKRLKQIDDIEERNTLFCELAERAVSRGYWSVGTGLDDVRFSMARKFWRADMPCADSNSWSSWCRLEGFACPAAKKFYDTKRLKVTA